MATAAAIVSIVGTGISVRKQNLAARAQRRQNAIEQRAAEITNARNRRIAARNAQIEQARNVQSAANTGTQFTTALTGANESIQSQASSAIGFSTFQESTGAAAGAQANRVTNFTRGASTAAAIAGLPGQLGAQPSFENIYSTAKKGFSAVLDVLNPGSKSIAVQ
jgi:hypothetical protein